MHADDRSTFQDEDEDTRTGDEEPAFRSGEAATELTPASANYGESPRSDSPCSSGDNVGSSANS